MNPEEAKGILPIEEYEMMLDRLLRRLDGYSQPPRYMIDCCSTVARMCEAKRSLSETRRFREAMELAEQFKDAIEMEAGRSDAGKLAVDEDTDADAPTS